MTTSQFCIIATIVVYLVAMVLVGVYCSRKGGGSSSHEFYLGGRKLGPIVTAMSAEASDMSSYLLMGLPGLAYLCGVAEVGWTAIGLAIGTYLNWLIVAKRLRRYSAKIGAITIPGFFSQRFRDRRSVLSCIAAVVILIFFIPYTASGFKAIGTLFNSLFGVDYHGAMIIGAIVVIGYTVLGGFLAVSTTDLIQSIIMTFALIFIVLFGIQQAGGWELVAANASSLPGYLNFTQGYDAATGQASSYGALSIASTLAWGLGYFGMPHILLRFMGIQDPKKLKVSRRVGSIWVTIAMGIAIFIGVLGMAMVRNGAIAAVDDSERILIAMATKLSTFGIIPALLAGVVMAGILACTMSTCDSQLLAASSSVSENILKGVFGLKISDKTGMRFARLTLLVISVIGVILARDPNSSVFQIVSFAWAGFGGAFGAVVLCALFWRRANRWGALAGMLGGGATVFIWKFAVRPLGGAWDIYELLPAFLVSLILIVVVSLLTPAPSKEITDEFDQVKAMRD